LKAQLEPTSGQGWARGGFGVGVAVSIAANVARVYVPPHNAASDWSPHPGAIGFAAFWPIALLISVETISRVQWPQGRSWWLMRYGGLTAVAAIAAIISYRHMSGLLDAYGEEGIAAILGPLAVDGLMVVSSGALMAISHNRREAARVEDAPELVTQPAQQMPTAAAQEPSERVPEVSTVFGPDVDATALLELESQ
jgi:hypothetical protein